MISRILYKFLQTRAGKKKYQEFFEHLNLLSLSGMYIGTGAFTDCSGEEHVLNHINHTFKESPKLTVFDVGANVGNYAVLIHKIIREKAKIFCFEPSAQTYKKLIQNTTGIQGLECYNFGFGNSPGEVMLFSDAETSGLASLYNRRLDHFNIQMNKRETIKIRTIDDFCAGNSIPHIHFLKMDVEGHEIKVLEGAKTIIASGNVDFIQFEFGGCNIDSRTFFQDFYYLLKDQFHIYRVVKDGLFKIEKYKELYEAFATTNFVAERKNLNE